MTGAAVRLSPASTLAVTTALAAVPSVPVPLVVCGCESEIGWCWLRVAMGAGEREAAAELVTAGSGYSDCRVHRVITALGKGSEDGGVYPRKVTTYKGFGTGIRSTVDAPPMLTGAAELSADAFSMAAAEGSCCKSNMDGRRASNK